MNVANDEQSVWLHQFKTDISCMRPNLLQFLFSKSLYLKFDPWQTKLTTRRIICKPQRTYYKYWLLEANKLDNQIDKTDFFILIYYKSIPWFVTILFFYMFGFLAGIFNSELHSLLIKTWLRNNECILGYTCSL